MFSTLRNLTPSPVSVSVLGFPYEKVRERTLYLQVLDYDRFSRNDPIGEVSIPLNKVELGQIKTFWKELKPCSDGSVREGGRAIWLNDDESGVFFQMLHLLFYQMSMVLCHLLTYFQHVSSD